MPNPSLPPRRVVTRQTRSQSKSSSTTPTSRTKAKSANFRPVVVASAVILLAVLVSFVAFKVTRNSDSSVDLAQADEQQAVEIISECFDVPVKLAELVSQCRLDSDPEQNQTQFLQEIDTLYVLARRAYRVPTLHPDRHATVVLENTAAFQEFSMKKRAQLEAVLTLLNSANTKAATRILGNIEQARRLLGENSPIVLFAVISPPNIDQQRYKPFVKINTDLRTDCRMLGLMMDNKQWKDASDAVSIAADEIERHVKEIEGTGLRLDKKLSADIAVTLTMIATSGDYIVNESYLLVTELLASKTPVKKLLADAKRIKDSVNRIRPAMNPIISN